MRPAWSSCGTCSTASPATRSAWKLTARYQLSADDGLQVTVSAANAGSADAPYGTGLRPYLTAGTPLVDACPLELPAAQWLAADDHGVPARRARRRGRDPSSTSGPAGPSAAPASTTPSPRWPRTPTAGCGHGWPGPRGPQLEFWAGPGYSWLQVFTGDALAPDRRRRALAIEPMTCPPNALVSGTDLITLAPGEQVQRITGESGSRAGDTVTVPQQPRDPIQVGSGVDVVGPSGVAALHQRDQLRAGAQERPGAERAPVASAMTSGQCSRPSSTGLRGWPS